MSKSIVYHHCFGGITVLAVMCFIAKVSTGSTTITLCVLVLLVAFILGGCFYVYRDAWGEKLLFLSIGFTWTLIRVL